MKEKWFKNSLRNKLKTENHDLDFNQVWKDIEVARSKKKKRRPFFWIWGLLVAILFGVVLSGLYYNQKEKQIVLDNNQSYVLSSEDKQSIKEDIDNNLNKEFTVKSLIDEQVDIQSKVSENSKKLVASTSNTSASFSILGSVNSDLLDLKNDQQTALSTKTDEIDEEIVALDNLNFAPVLLSEVNLLELKTPSTFITLNRKIASSPEYSPVSRIRPVYSLPSMISLNAAYGINESNINASNDSISALIDRRETLESNLDYFSFGIAYKKFINQKIFFSLGLNYGQYTSSFQYQDYTFISGSRVDTTEIIIYNDGMMEFVSEEVPFVTTQITQNVNYLKYKTLQIPIGLGLNVDLNDQYNFEIESGLSYNFISMNSGRVVSNESDFNLLSELSENYKSSNLWSAYAGFSIHRQLSDDWRIGLGLNANFDLSNRVNNDAGYSHKFRSYAGQLSISRIF